MPNPSAPELPVAGKFIYVPNDLIRPKPDWVSQSLWRADGADIPADLRGGKTYDGLPVALTLGRKWAASLGEGETRSLIFETFFVKTTGGGKTVVTRPSKSPIAVPNPIPLLAGMFCFAPVSGGLFVVWWGRGVVEVDVEEVTGPEPDPPEKPRPPPVITIKYFMTFGAGARVDNLVATAGAEAFYMFAQFGTGKYELYYVYRKDGGGWKLARVVIPATMREFDVTELRNGHNGRVRVRAYDDNLVNELWVMGTEATVADFSIWKNFQYKLSHGVEIASGVVVFGRQGMSRVSGSMFRQPRCILDSSDGHTTTELFTTSLINSSDSAPVVSSVGAGLALAVMASPWPLKQVRFDEGQVVGWWSKYTGLFEIEGGASYVASSPSQDLIVTDGSTAWMGAGREGLGDDVTFLDKIHVHPLTGGKALIGMTGYGLPLGRRKSLIKLFDGKTVSLLSTEKIAPASLQYENRISIKKVVVVASGEIIVEFRTQDVSFANNVSEWGAIFAVLTKNFFEPIGDTKVVKLDVDEADRGGMTGYWQPYQALGGSVCFLRTISGSVDARWFRAGALMKTLTVTGQHQATHPTGAGFFITVKGTAPTKIEGIRETGSSLYYLADTDNGLVKEYVGPIVLEEVSGPPARVAKDLWALPMGNGVFLFSPIPYVGPETPQPHRHFSLRKITDWGATREKIQCLGEYLLHVAPASIYDLRSGGAVNNPPY